MRKGLTNGAAIIALGLSLLAAPAAAQESAPEALMISAVNTTAERTERAATAGYLPGDVIEYELRFTNITEAVVQDVVLNDPIPQGLIMVLGSPTADRQDVVVDYSIDGGESWSAAPTVQVQEGDRTVSRPAPADAYTHVRWTITGAVPADATVTARFHAMVRGNVDKVDAR